MLPGSSLPKAGIFEKIYLDKWVHITLFSTLVALFSFPLKKQVPSNSLVYLYITLLCLMYGVGMEFMQRYFANGRSFDVWDMVADAVGCSLGFLFTKWQIKRLPVEKK